MVTKQPVDGDSTMKDTSSVVMTDESGNNFTSSSVIQQVTQLLQAQKEMMAAQVEAMATNSILPLKVFSGDDFHTEDGSFDRWLEDFEDRVKAANWNDNQKLFQLKSHLEKTTAHVVRMMSSEGQVKYTSVVSTLKKRFRPLDIEELKGLEFHQLMQDKQSMEELGVALQKLAQKVFPARGVKEFDRLLKGRFYQALLLKWQRKLGALKTDETFEDLTSKLERVDERIRGIVRPILWMGFQRRQTHLASKRQATIGTPIRSEMTGVEAKVVSTVEGWDIFSEIVQSLLVRRQGDLVARCHH